jgi:hypothetical protein
MVNSMKENSKTTKEMGEELTTSEMEIYMRENS